ncbi:MAG: hypothetical protein AAF447_25210, partial [Myxococcota bacterium]
MGHEHAERQVREVDEQEQAEVHRGHRAPGQAPAAGPQNEDWEGDLQRQRAPAGQRPQALRQREQPRGVRPRQRVFEHVAHGRPVLPARR